MYEILNDIF